MDVVNLIQTNFTIVLGVFVTLAVMGITTLVDNRNGKGEGKGDLPKSREMRSSFDMDEKRRNPVSKKTNILSGITEKLGNLAPKKAGKTSKSSETKPLKPKNGANGFVNTMQNKMSVFSSFLRGKKDKSNIGKPGLKSDQKTGTSKFNGTDKTSGFDVDKIVEAKKGEFDFDDDLLTEMSTAGSIKTADDSSLNSDLSFDQSEFDMGFGDLPEESTEDDLFNTGAEKIAITDDHDSLLDSLKKDIVISKENKIDFMTAMKDENLDLKSIKSDLEDVLQNLKRYRQRSSHN